MSPEIFKNKPYSYKSDVWALGCVLYEMTTLNHAFDANSLNGLATKIVKGKYPPINAKYSKYLAELIGQMLQLNPQQRPDLDQILRKPFIKKHIVNFFTDIAARPSASIGEGTMIFKAAAGGPVQSASVGNDTNMISLRQQLHTLGLTKDVSDALAPKASPQDDFEAIKYAREQASALQREKEHKKMVEAALEKLRQERENRAKERATPAAIVRPSGYPIQQARYAGRNVRAGGAGAGVPSAAGAPPSISPANRNAGGGGGGVGMSAIENARREAVRRQQQQQQQQSDDASVDSAAHGGRGDPSRRRSFGEDADRERERNRLAERERRAADERKRLQQAQHAQAIADEKRREEARAEAAAARAREEARIRDESRAKEDMVAKLRVEQIKVEQVRAQAEMAAKAKREAQRDRERARQKEEFDQLKRDKLELDRRAQERERLRDERRAQERERLEGNRKEQMEVVQEKLSHMNEQISRIEKNPVNPRYRAEEKPVSGAGQGQSEELSARDRVQLRRQEKLAREESERLEALRIAEQDNRRIRQEANGNLRQLYHADADPPREYGNHGAGAGAAGGYEFDIDRGAGKGSGGLGAGGKARAGSGMEAGELQDRLADARGRGNRYQPFFLLTSCMRCVV
jgi:hypothetical protein